MKLGLFQRHSVKVVAHISALRCARNFAKTSSKLRIILKFTLMLIDRFHESHEIPLNCPRL